MFQNKLRTFLATAKSLGKTKLILDLRYAMSNIKLSRLQAQLQADTVRQCSCYMYTGEMAAVTLWMVTASSPSSFLPKL